MRCVAGLQVSLRQLCLPVEPLHRVSTQAAQKEASEQSRYTSLAACTICVHRLQRASHQWLDPSSVASERNRDIPSCQHGEVQNITLRIKTKGDPDLRIVLLLSVWGMLPCVAAPHHHATFACSWDSNRGLGGYRQRCDALLLPWDCPGCHEPLRRQWLHVRIRRLCLQVCTDQHACLTVPMWGQAPDVCAAFTPTSTHAHTRGNWPKSSARVRCDQSQLSWAARPRACCVPCLANRLGVRTGSDAVIGINSSTEGAVRSIHARTRRI